MRVSTTSYRYWQSWHAAHTTIVAVASLRKPIYGALPSLSQLLSQKFGKSDLHTLRKVKGLQESTFFMQRAGELTHAAGGRETQPALTAAELSPLCGKPHACPPTHLRSLAAPGEHEEQPQSSPACPQRLELCCNSATCCAARLLSVDPFSVLKAESELAPAVLEEQALVPSSIPLLISLPWCGWMTVSPAALCPSSLHHAISLLWQHATCRGEQGPGPAGSLLH